MTATPPPPADVELLAELHAIAEGICRKVYGGNIVDWPDGLCNSISRALCNVSWPAPLPPGGHILAEAPAVADVGHTTDLREIQERKASRDTGGDIEHETTLINRGAEDITTLLATVARLTARVAELEKAAEPLIECVAIVPKTVQRGARISIEVEHLRALAAVAKGDR